MATARFVRTSTSVLALLTCLVASGESQELSREALQRICQRQFNELVTAERRAGAGDSPAVGSLQDRLKAAESENDRHLRAARGGRVVKPGDGIPLPEEKLRPLGLTFIEGIGVAENDGKLSYVFNTAATKTLCVKELQDFAKELKAASLTARTKGEAELKAHFPELVDQLATRYAASETNQVERTKRFYIAFEHPRPRIQAETVGVFIESFRVIQVLGPDEMLILHGKFPAPIRVLGFPTAGLEDVASVRDPLLVVGQSPYEARDGVTRNIWVLKRLAPETVREIQSALTLPAKTGTAGR